MDQEISAKMKYIYALFCPIDGLPKYIGSTVNLHTRLWCHMKSPQRGCEEWMGILTSNSKVPVIEVLDFIEEKNVKQIETYWIHQFLVWGFKLFNISLVINRTINFCEKKVVKKQVDHLRTGMKVPQEKLTQWRAQYEHGDYVEAKELFGIHPIVMSRIIKTGRGSKKSVAMIRDFYNGKEQRLNSFYSKPQ